MALKSYQKAPLKIKIDKINEHTAPELMEVVEAETEVHIKSPQENSQGTFVRTLLKNSKYVFPAITGLLGLSLLLSEVIPFGRQILTEKYTDKYDQEIIALADPKVLGIEDSIISNPGSEYFQSLVSAIEEKSKQSVVPDEDFSDKFYISIPSIGANSMAVSPNINSYDEKYYEPILERTLAHFKGTCLPFQECNAVIYGHSASGLIGNNSKYILSKLSDNANVGDDITININGEDIHYKITKTKIVDPKDLSVIENVKSRRSLTLITCYPNGSNAKRYVAVAEEI